MKKRATIPAILIALTASFSIAEEDAREKIVFQFLGNYCLECHDTNAEEGEREFETFDLPLTTVADLISADEIIDQVTLKEMPPKDADAKPNDDERIAVVRALRESIDVARGNFKNTGGRTVIRRLSNREYENTLEILFGRRVDTLGLTADFPKEKTSHHMDTIGESLVTSGFLLDQYFQAAHRLVESRLGKPKMEPKSWHFTKNFVQYEELTGSHKSAFKNEFLALYEQPNTDTRQGGYGHIEDFLEGVPVSGLYDIEVHVQAKHRDTHYDPAIFGIDFSEPFQLAVVPGDVTKGHIHYPQAIEPILAKTIVPDDKPEWKKFRVWLEKGQTPRFIFPNGPYESRASVIQVNKRYKDEFEGKVSSSGVGRAHILKQGALPHIKIGEIKIAGPQPEEKGGKEEQAVFGKDGFKEKRALDQLYAFGARAFRRPLEGADKDRIRKTYEKRISEKASPRQAALDTVKMILCSPSFLYLSEVTDEANEALGPYDLASRLSYALLAGPPDPALLQAAADGSLTKPEKLRAEAKRILGSEESFGFINGFLDSWLNLRELGQMPPPRERNRAFYAEDLPTSMKQEARLFFRHLLDENGSVTDFLDADYTFVDKKLAKLYQLPEKEKLRLADGFEKVSLKNTPQRGGLLGMAGVLTVSANGVETSPVTRGVFVSENILGIPPPPPPDEVPAIDADTRGATTIREKLAKHSSDKNCAECHRKIDPLGFGLETFDPIGQWRSNYPSPGKGVPAPKIDPSGEFPSGETFADFSAFKQVLLESRREIFTENLIKQILTYATGRHMEPVDDYEIGDILKRVKEDNYGLETLVLECMTSEIFRTR
ncbi:MAG: DUF1592 domain-containing protein [Verrucomicrobiales bacterium]|nr:DUF1592 domain-containing protein [Verrucomicrobiales bacterium]